MTEKILGTMCASLAPSPCVSKIGLAMLAGRLTRRLDLKHTKGKKSTMQRALPHTEAAKGEKSRWRLCVLA